MANFCTKCGKPLGKSGMCDCMQRASDAVKEEVQQGLSEQVRAMQGDANQTAQEIQTDAKQVVPETRSDADKASQQSQYQQQYQQPRQQQYQQPGQQQYQQPGRQQQQYQQPGQQPYQQQYQQQYQQPYQQHYQQQPYQPSREMEWVNGQKDKVVAEAKNIFAEIGPLFIRPASHTKELADKNSAIMGFEFIGAKAIIGVMIMLAALMKMGIFEYIDVETKLKMVFMVLIFVGGVDIIEAALLKACTGIFGIDTTFNKMITVSGTKALFDIAVAFATGLVALVSVQFGMLVLAAGAVLTTYIQFGGFSRVVERDDDKKAYIMAIVKIVVAVLIGLLYKVSADNLMGGLVQNMFGGMF